jgi:hypothetical protein
MNPRCHNSFISLPKPERERERERERGGGGGGGGGKQGFFEGS